ncbi:heme ABC transporter ATP-binding protein [Echinicola sp. CAU 1574]|uniref:Heme ABC transporter ATP-binding protein n=1 Tax=Echinicola arenosa TaxID=2774144 RepID=A0ABR9APB0_9BACT|nr:heme ABC transporter ATP-binding protein [Echinicola arenosa]MBD8490616.1 heme ABC transporter ATP-binding protein [Echinicola arenosa]
MITANGIHFCLKNRPILEEIDVSISSGELAVVLGPNGAGKSTLLKLLTGEQVCSNGKITINGEAIESLKTNELAKYRAVMPQHSVVNFPFSVEEIVGLGALSHDKQTRSSQLLEEVMKLTQVEAFRHRMINELSGGERQRVHLARVLLQIWEDKPFPRYLFLDEPTSSMDIAQQHLVLSIVQQLKKRNIGVFAILHDLNLAAQYADKILLMKEGNIRYSGSVQETMQEEKLTEIYGHPISVLPHPSIENALLISSEALVNNKQYISFKTA